MIRVTFLGVGAALPFPGQTNCAYLVETSEACILFDCGPAILQQLASIGRTPGDITHVFISHGHGDHALGYPMFLLWWTLEGCHLDRSPPMVIASDKTWPHLQALWKHSYGEIPAFAFDTVELPHAHPSSVTLPPSIHFATWPMQHSTLFPVLGARFEIGETVLAFSGDTARCDNVVPLAKGADLFVADSRYARGVSPQRDSQSRYHCSALDVGEYAELAGAKRLALVHIGAEYEGRHDAFAAEAKLRFTGEVSAPKAGEVIELP